MTDHNEDFVIDKASWHSHEPGDTASLERQERRFRSVATYLQDHGLAARPILAPGQPVGDDFAIRAQDLTREGMAVVRSAYDKWVGKIDRGLDPGDMTLFDRALKKIRGEASGTPH